MKIIEYAKEHPWTIAGVIGAAVVLYIVVSNAGSGGGGVTVAGGANSDPSLQIAQLQLQGRSQELNAQLSAANLSAGIALSIEELRQATQQYGIQTAGTVQLAGIAVQHDIGLATLTSQENIAQIGQLANLANIAATRDVALANAASYAHIADVQAGVATSAFSAQTAQAQISSQTAIKVAKYSQPKDSGGGVLGWVLDLF